MHSSPDSIDHMLAAGAAEERKQIMGRNMILMFMIASMLILVALAVTLVVLVANNSKRINEIGVEIGVLDTVAATPSDVATA